MPKLTPKRLRMISQKTMVIKYPGKMIYDKKQNLFIINGKHYSPTLLSIV
jgi:hypothetical protein